MENIEFLGVEIKFTIPVTDEIRNSLDLGSLTLKKNDRSYLMDVDKSWVLEDGFGIGCSLIEDREVLTESNYDLTSSDLIVSRLDEATLYIGEEYLEEPEFMTLFVKSGGSLTKAIDLKID